ncbi:hypothetical protein C5Y96_06575 [Blastopirellula marina]|uniref:Uncharacterized protein n=1 Tax=Blastopirellula marina TaxID=124 RepID=A0A2S8FXC1_9BACT|nr:hypothetical protein C5Y96_06575 [Blastopirellula marina]RCS53542.1 hypothetical protein DTL36_06585 [Bremerella cremea]
MIQPRQPTSGFADSEFLVTIAVLGLSLGLLLPTVKRLQDLGFSWWLSILLGLVPVALFWIAFATVVMVFFRIALWLENKQS